MQFRSQRELRGRQRRWCAVREQDDGPARAYLTPRSRATRCSEEVERESNTWGFVTRTEGLEDRACPLMSPVVRLQIVGAEGGTRTPTGLLPQAPEACASANSA